MRGLFTLMTLLVALVQLIDAMPLFNENGLQEDRGYQTCYQDCAFKRKECLRCPELFASGSARVSDEEVVFCQTRCSKQYEDCIGNAGTSHSAPTGCHSPGIRDLY